MKKEIYLKHPCLCDICLEARNKEIKRIIEEDIKRLEKQLIWAGDTKAESGEEVAINFVLLQEISFKKSQLKEIRI